MVDLTSPGTTLAVPVGAAVVDFDGAACPHDVTEALLRAFAPPTWWEVETEMRDRRRTLRQALIRQAALLTAGRDEMLGFALDRFELEPTFVPFVEWAWSQGVTVTVASDGLGFYIGPMLTRAGVDGVVAVRANDYGPDGLRFPSGHPVCVGCGTCKMLAVQRPRDAETSVAFVGEGYSDRFGAAFADVTFAKHHLVEICAADQIPFLPWDDFGDVRQGIERLNAGDDGLAGRAAPERCPGWTEPGSERARTDAPFG